MNAKVRIARRPLRYFPGVWIASGRSDEVELQIGARLDDVEEPVRALHPVDSSDPENSPIPLGGRNRRNVIFLIRPRTRHRDDPGFDAEPPAEHALLVPRLDDDPIGVPEAISEKNPFADRLHEGKVGHAVGIARNGVYEFPSMDPTPESYLPGDVFPAVLVMDLRVGAP